MYELTEKELKEVSGGKCLHDVLPGCQPPPKLPSPPLPPHFLSFKR